MPLVDTELFRRFDLTSNEKSVISASHHLLVELGATLEIQGQIPQTGPLLIISNHPGALDTHAIIVSSQRQDLHHLALASYQAFGEKGQEKLIPIYLKTRVTDKALALFAGDLVSHTLDDQEEVQKRNRQSITQAAQIVNQEMAVVVFPTGSAGKQPIGNSLWKPGVGYIVQQIDHPDTNVVFAHVKGGNKRDLYRYLHPHLREIFFQDKIITVNYSQPYPLTSLTTSSLNARKITSQLEKAYIHEFPSK